MAELQGSLALSGAGAVLSLGRAHLTMDMKSPEEDLQGGKTLLCKVSGDLVGHLGGGRTQTLTGMVVTFQRRLSRSAPIPAVISMNVQVFVLTNSLTWVGLLYLPSMC